MNNYRAGHAEDGRGHPVTAETDQHPGGREPMLRSQLAQKEVEEESASPDKAQNLGEGVQAS